MSPLEQVDLTLGTAVREAMLRVCEKAKPLGDNETLVETEGFGVEMAGIRWLVKVSMVGDATPDAIATPRHDPV